MGEVAEEEAARPRSRQIESDYLATLLNSLTVEQMREAAFRLAPQRRVPIRKHADAQSALMSIGAEPSKLIEALLTVEQLHPFKHCLLLRLAKGPASFPTAGQVYSAGQLQFRFSFHSTKPALALTFEHSVESREWVEVEPDVKKRRVVRTRQPIVVRVLPERNLVTLNYPGITHSGADGGPASYEHVVQALIQVLEASFGFELRTIPLKDSLALLLEGANKRVLRVTADVDSPLARVNVSSKATGNIEEALGAFIAKHLVGVDSQQVAEAARKAFNGASFNSIVLFWLAEGLFTRLRFWEIGTELYFVWNQETPSYRTVDSVAAVLASAQRLSAENESAAPFQWVSQREPGTVVTPGELAATHALQPSRSREILVEAMRAGLVEPVYRLKTIELLHELSNEWSGDLQRFKRVVNTDSGVRIDGTDPENIEVAFRRISQPGRGNK